MYSNTYTYGSFTHMYRPIMMQSVCNHNIFILGTENSTEVDAHTIGNNRKGRTTLAIICIQTDGKKGFRTHILTAKRVYFFKDLLF